METLKVELISVGLIDHVADYMARPVEWRLVLSYTNALRAGVKLPPITVGRIGERYAVVFGNHRLDAAKAAKMTEIEAIVTKEPQARWLLMASEDNEKNGLRLSTYQRMLLYERLRSQGVDDRSIASAFQTTGDSLAAIIAKRIRVLENGARVVVKAAIADCSTQLETPTKRNQAKIACTDAYAAMDSLLGLLKLGAIDPGDELARNRAEELVDLLNELLERTTELVNSGEE
jgi:hypothetical protein